MKRQYAIKSIVVVTSFVALASGWALDRYRLNRNLERVLKEHEQELVIAEYDRLMSEAYEEAMERESANGSES